MEEFEDTAMNWLTGTKKMVGPKTTTRRITSLKSFAKWARWDASFEDYAAPTPLKGTPHPIPEGVDGVKRMIEVCNDDRHKALVVLCGLLGLRMAEALAVRAEDFNFEEQVLTVRGKGDKVREVPVSSFAWEVIQMAVFRAYCEQRKVVNLRDRFARALITRLGVRAGLRRHIASHDLRATFATEVYNKTRDQRLVQELLGHASGTQTEVYILRNRDQLKAGVEL
jgi:integrase